MQASFQWQWLRSDPHEAEAIAVTKARWRIEVAIRRPAVQRVEVTATTPKNAISSGRRPLRISLLLCTIAGIPIAAPLPYIAVHVVQTPCIGLLLPNLMRLIR
jgi:hypothetical protein